MVLVSITLLAVWGQTVARQGAMFPNPAGGVQLVRPTSALGSFEYKCFISACSQGAPIAKPSMQSKCGRTT